jgi:hypothetical protein
LHSVNVIPFCTDLPGIHARTIQILKTGIQIMTNQQSKCRIKLITGKSKKRQGN